MDQTVTFQEHPKWVPGRIAEAYIHAGIMRTRILKVKALISLGMQIQRIKYITRGKEGVCIWQNKTKQQADRPNERAERCFLDGVHSPRKKSCVGQREVHAQFWDNSLQVVSQRQAQRKLRLRFSVAAVATMRTFGYFSHVFHTEETA